MKKYIIVVCFVSLFLLTGCNNIYKLEYDNIVNEALSYDNSKENTYLQGYKLYLPPHMSLIGDLKSNNILYSYGDKYYLYVDLISYYNKKENKYNIFHDSYVYSKEFNDDGLSGYVVVSESKGGFLVEVMYNYAKIEVVTDDINRAITDSIVVLKNIKYNYKIIDSMIGSNALVYDSEAFTLLGPEKDSSDNFLSYEEEYGNYDENDSRNIDDDFIDIDSVE